MHATTHSADTRQQSPEPVSTAETESTKGEGKQFYHYYLFIVNSTLQKHHCKPDKQVPLWSRRLEAYLINIWVTVKTSPELNF